MKQRTSQLVLQVSLKAVVLAVLLGLLTPHLFGAPCSGLPTEAQLKTFLAKAAAGTGISASLGPGTGVGGIFSGKLMWAAVVDRNGVICAYVTSTSDPTQVWPGSQQIAKAKAYTANAFSVRPEQPPSETPVAPFGLFSFSWNWSSSELKTPARRTIIS